MSSPSLDLQTAIYERLMSDAGLADVFEQLTKDEYGNPVAGVRIYDNVPSNPMPKDLFPYISFGPSYYNTADSECIRAREETLQVDCWTSDHGKKRPCRILTDAVKRSLHGYSVDLDGANALVEMEVALVRVMDDPSESIVHGVLQVTAIIEEGQ